MIGEAQRDAHSTDIGEGKGVSALYIKVTSSKCLLQPLIIHIDPSYDLICINWSLSQQSNNICLTSIYELLSMIKNVNLLVVTKVTLLLIPYSDKFDKPVTV